MKKQWIVFCLIFAFCVVMLGGCKKNSGEDFAYPTVSEPVDEEPKETELPKEDPDEEPDQNQEETSAEEVSKEEEPVQEQSSEKEEKTPVAETSPSESKENIQTETSTVKEELANLYETGHNGVTINFSGKDEKNSSYAVSKAVTVNAGNTLTFGPASSAQVVLGYAYDENGKPLERINASLLKEEATFDYGMKLYTYTVPKGAQTVKMNVPGSLKSQFVIARNYTFTLKEYQSLTGVASHFVDDPLKDKKALFLGDSICMGSRDSYGGERAWAARIAAETGLIATNGGVSGASVSDTRASKYGTILDQLNKAKGKDYEYIVLHGGVNDAWDSAPVGTVSEVYDPIFFDTSTYAGGLETLFYHAITLYGDQASIGYLINFKAPNCSYGRIADMSAYNEVAVKICEKWGVTYFDMYNHKEITAELKFTTNTHTTDFIHPSASGYDILAPYIADYMRTMTPCNQKIFDLINES